MSLQGDKTMIKYLPLLRINKSLIHMMESTKNPKKNVHRPLHLANLMRTFFRWSGWWMLILFYESFRIL